MLKHIKNNIYTNYHCIVDNELNHFFKSEKLMKNPAMCDELKNSLKFFFFALITTYNLDVVAKF